MLAAPGAMPIRFMLIRPSSGSGARSRPAIATRHASDAVIDLVEDRPDRRFETMADVTKAVGEVR